MRLYEQAIRSARDNGFVHNEALAYELRRALLRGARVRRVRAMSICGTPATGYLRWGADGQGAATRRARIRTSDEEEPAPGPTSTIAAPVEHLDLATVIKVSQAVSGEIVLEKLIDTLMRTAIEQAGAERGSADSSARRRAADRGGSHDRRRYGDRASARRAVAAAVLPESVLHYVVAHPTRASFSTMPRPSPRLPRIPTSVSARLAPFSACP